jgi:hypothetical protein
MNWRLTEATCWGLACMFFAAAGVRTANFQAAPFVKPSLPTARGVLPGVLSLRAEAGFVIGNNPFRLDRSAPTAESMGLTAGEGIEVHAAPAGPALTLAGIIGPPWRALLEGLPGVQGQILVAAGDRIGELSIRSVGHTQVVVAERDTTWILTMDSRWR